MGKSSKPLNIAIPSSMETWDEIAQLKAQGHLIRVVSDDCDCDIVLGPTCWLMDDAHRKYLPLAIAEARRRRYPPTKKESA